MNFVFELPPEDQKIIGDWRAYIYLYNKNNEKLISYNVFEFSIREKSDQTDNLVIMLTNLLGVAVAALSIMAVLLRFKKNEIEDIIKYSENIEDWGENIENLDSSSKGKQQ